MVKKALIVLIPALILIGCQNSDSPQTVASKYMESLVKEDWSGACSLLDKESQEALKRAKEECPKHLERGFNSVATLQTSSRVKKLSLNKNVAVFQTDITGANLTLKKEDGAWRVSLLEES